MKHLKKFNENYISLEFENNNKIRIPEELLQKLKILFKSLSIKTKFDVISDLESKKLEIFEILGYYNDKLDDLRLDCSIEISDIDNNRLSYLRDRITNISNFKLTEDFHLYDRHLHQNDKMIYFNLPDTLNYTDDDWSNIYKIYDELESSLLSQYFIKIVNFNRSRIPTKHSPSFFNVSDCILFYEINTINNFSKLLIFTSGFDIVEQELGVNIFSSHIWNEVKDLCSDYDIMIKMSHDMRTIQIYFFDKKEYLKELRRKK